VRKQGGRERRKEGERKRKKKEKRREKIISFKSTLVRGLP
jgi:hypothetical protein